MGKLRVAVLQSDYRDSTTCWTDIDPACQPHLYDKANRYEWGSVFIKKATAVKQIQQLVRSGKWDVYLNLCDGAFDEDTPGMEVVQTLERLGVPYTGAAPHFYEPSKPDMKGAAFYHGIYTAPWAQIMDVHMTDDEAARAQLADAVAGMTYPLIAKHYSGGGSVGMGRDCKCADLDALVAQVRKFVGEYGGVLVEEFIEGREFTVLVMEGEDPDTPVALVPVECVFGRGESFKHFDLKWHDYESMSWRVIDSVKDGELDAALRAAACGAFKALRGVSYGRADFRVTNDGRVVFLEMNPNCGVFYPPDAMGSADFILTLDPKVDHQAFIDGIVGRALQRVSRAKAAKMTEVRYRHAIGGFGLYATRDIAPGEVVLRYEETPHTLVSRTYIESTFGPAAMPGPSPADALAPQPGAPYRASKASAAGAVALSVGVELGSGVSDTCSSLTPSTPSSTSSSHASLASLDQASGSPADSTCSGKVVSVGAAEEQGGRQQQAVLGVEAAAEAAALAAAAGTGKELPLRAEWFRAYAYPITDDTWVTWSEDPKEWLPINHSCDPNTWLCGLDLVARKHIAKGDQITSEYATFTVHNMREFTCRCGAPNCRGTVRGTDYLAPWVGTMYAGHTSDYVAAKRRLMAGAAAAAATGAQGAAAAAKAKGLVAKAVQREQEVPAVC
mmetsp:Transcript_24213/g.61589  ORF Transcript_24213/g.61589 Transcript_24213/m.61589 type:complete len:672 (-) Transcript_24213:441-2456(-)